MAWFQAREPIGGPSLAAHVDRVRSRYQYLYELPVRVEPDGGRSFHQGRLFRRHGVNVLFLRGDATEMAFQHGRLLAEEIGHGAVSASARLIEQAVANAIGRQGPLQDWLVHQGRQFVCHRLVAAGIAQSERQLGAAPGLEEAVALSEASGRPLEEFLYGALNPDVLMLLAQWSGSQMGFDGPLAQWIDGLAWCSSFAAWGGRTFDGSLLVGRNMDFPLHGFYDRYPTVIYFEPQEGPLRYMSFASAGVHNAGLTAYNEAGLFLAAHTVPTSDVSWAGVSPLLVANQVIRTARTLDEALELFGRFSPPTGWAYLLVSSQERRAGSLEMSATSQVFREERSADWHLQTNRFRAASKQSHNAWINRSVWDDVEGRYDRLAQLVAPPAKPLDVAAALAVLSDQWDPVAGKLRGLGSTIGVHTNVTSVVLDPAQRRVFVACGEAPVCHNSYFSLPLAGEVDAASFAARDGDTVQPSTYPVAHPGPFAAVKHFIQAKIAYEQRGDVAAAYELLQRSQHADPGNPAYAFQAAIFALKRSAWSAAEQHLNQVLASPQGTAQLQRLAHYYLGRLFAHTRERERALMELARVRDDATADAKLREAAARASDRLRRRGRCPLRARSLTIMMQHSDMLSY